MNALFAKSAYPQVKKTRDAEIVITAYLRLRGASRADVVEGSSKNRAVVMPRHELMWLLRDLTFLSKSAIGRLIGGRDYATVDSGIANIADRLAASAEYRAQIQQARAYILACDQTDPDPQNDAATVLARRVLLDPDSTATGLLYLRAVVRAGSQTIGNIGNTAVHGGVIAATHQLADR